MNTKPSNYDYEQHKTLFANAYRKCFTEHGVPIICTPEDKRELLRIVQDFASKTGLADNRTYFGSVQRAYINEPEVSKIYRMTCYDL